MMDRRAPFAEQGPSTPDAVLGIRAGDMPVKVQEYAQNVHGQMEDLYARIGIASCEEIEGLPREALLAHAEDIAQLEHLLLRLHEALAHPDIAEYRVTERTDLAWYKKIAAQLEAHARETAVEWMSDSGVRVERVLGDVHLQLLDSQDDAARDRMEQELDAEFTAQRSGIARGNLLIGAAEMGFVDWAKTNAGDHDIELGLIRGHAIRGEVQEAWEIFRRRMGEDLSDRLVRYSDYAAELFVAAAKAGAEDIIAAIQKDVTFADQGADLRARVFEALLEERNFDAAELIIGHAEELRIRMQELRSQRYFAGEDMTETYKAECEDAVMRRAYDEAGCAAVRLPHDLAKDAYADIVTIFEEIPENDTVRRVEAATVLAQLAHDLHEPVSSWINFIEETCGDLQRGDYDSAMLYYAPILAQVGNTEKALVYVASVKNIETRILSRSGVIDALIARGETADVVALLRVSLDELARETPKRGHNIDVSSVCTDVAEQAIAVRDVQLFADAWQHIRPGVRMRHATQFARAMTEQGMNADAPLDSFYLRAPSPAPEDWKKYVVLAASLGKGSKFIARDSSFNFRNARPEKSQIARWLWDAAYDAKRKVKVLAEATGI